MAERAGLSEKRSAAMPATWGHAIEVPDARVRYWLKGLPIDVLSARSERIDTPGADTSTHLPYVENEAFLSLESVAATDNMWL